MKFENIEGLLMIDLDIISTLMVSLFLLLIGYILRKKIRFLREFCIPAPVIGGLIFAAVTLIGHYSNVFEFSINTTLQNVACQMFWATVGLGASFDTIKKGGKLLLGYWVLCEIIGIGQNFIGVGLAQVTGLDPLLGLMTGAIPLVGGHGPAASFGESAEALGHVGALAVAIASATFGLVAGSLSGGPLARKFIRKYDLKPSPDDYISDVPTETAQADEINTEIIFKQLTLMAVCMAFGSLFCSFLAKIAGLDMPGYIGTMFVALVIRNINDKAHLIDLRFDIMNPVGDVSLGIYLSMSMMTMKLWQLADIASSLSLILLTQFLFTALIAILMFRLLGKSYDAAVLCSGALGHSLGSTPNAIANMNSVTSQFGPSKRAFLIVPVVGGFFIDLLVTPHIIWCFNMFK